jgi:ribokinase
MAKRILVAGSLHHDVVVSAARLPMRDETLPGTSVAYVAGGKGRNQAVAVARNGGRAAIAGRIGDDAAGTMLKADLIAQGVDVAQLQTGTHEATGMSVAILMPSGDYGAVIVSGSNLTLDTDTIQVPDDVGFVVLQNEIPEAANLAIARKARAAGATVLLNAAPSRPLDGDLLGLVDILVVNRVEAAMLLERPVEDRADALEAAAALCALGIEKVLVTLGGDGVVHMRAGGRPESRAAFRAEVVSSHGAGDTFIGALVTQLAEGSDFAAAIHYAQAAAAVFISTETGRRDQIRPIHIRARLGED